MQPTLILILAVAAGLVVAFLARRRGGSGEVFTLAQAAAESGDLSALLAAAGALPVDPRSRFFQQAIVYLWENWQRPLAIKVIKEFARRHSSEKICQYWLRQALEVEPTLAGKELDRAFLTDYYAPEVAAACGRTSG